MSDKIGAILILSWIFSFGFIFGFNIGRENGRSEFIDKFYKQEFKIISKTSRVDGQYSYSVMQSDEKGVSYDFSTSDNLELNSTIFLKNE